MPSSAARPGTDHWPGGRLVSTAGRPFWLAADAALGGHGADLLAGEPAGALGRPESLGVEGVGDLPAAAAGVGELGDAGEERGEVRQLVQAPDGADGPPGGLVAAGPGDGHVDDLAVPGDVHGDVLDEDAQQFLAVGMRGGRRAPDLREVAGQGRDGGPLGGGEGGRAAPR